MWDNKVMNFIIKVVVLVVIIYFAIGSLLNFSGTCPTYYVDRPDIDIKTLASDTVAQKQIWQYMFCPFIKKI